ncbi:pyridoxal phosphate-dependent aminotransferase [Candidatus Eisenbacteria bacterium]|uniref:Aminotransferase n=1 Tax=Eiseniibacteriota bacterium TaxID=2212470 RepID=A0ABV6YIL1_UNCEI
MFASRIKTLRTSGIRKIFNLAASMESCIDMSIGQPRFDVPEPLVTAAKQAIQDGHNRYTPTGGIPELKEAVTGLIREHLGLEPEAVMITSGVSGGVVLACLALVEPGDEVIMPDPHFVIYRALVELCGGVPVFFDTYPDFKLRREELESRVTAKTKFILINSPQNPTGTCYGPTELEQIAEVAGAHDLLVVSDEIYNRFVYDIPARSMLQFYPKTLMLSGFTKAFAMPGWRLGHAAGPSDLIDVMETLQQFTFICAPAPLQKACASCVDLDITPHVEQYRRKRDRAYDGLCERFEVTNPGGAFYMFAKVPWPGRSATEFVAAAIERRLLLVPGNAFSTRDTHFRLCFGIPDNELEVGIAILNELAAHPPAGTGKTTAKTETDGVDLPDADDKKDLPEEHQTGSASFAAK